MGFSETLMEFDGDLMGSNGIYPLVNYRRPWQIGVGRLLSIQIRLFSGSILIYQMVMDLSP